eukprot:COSAG02_NODE_6637_length_3445_cov_15.508747_1_plen_115_part_00
MDEEIERDRQRARAGVYTGGVIESPPPAIVVVAIVAMPSLFARDGLLTLSPDTAFLRLLSAILSMKRLGRNGWGETAGLKNDSVAQSTVWERLFFSGQKSPNDSYVNLYINRMD